MDDQPQPPQDLQQAIEQIQQERRRSQMRWAAIGVLIVAVTATIYALGFQYREALFRPQPDMQEIEAAAFSTSNDPACREMMGNIDALQARWREQKGGLRELHASSDAAALQAGRDELKRFIEAYKIERRRLPIIIVHDPEVPADLSRYLKHALHYLGRMDELLQARQEALASPPAEGAPEAGADAAGAGAAQKPPEERYRDAWGAVSEDHEKWRVFRQGPIPCGKRSGAVPPLPDAVEVVAPSQRREAPAERPARLSAPGP